ncbi:DUF4153 domain-containing protein [Flavobacterium restrictum]|uniref:DUF4173 domain-containing protein n=1 Tax=Flavobacterium restrictum TaxID=2594428 RepID=A0A553E2D8_9FLAO|nr:DUF4153 domain-containing protein [Flavobacterium restrictum]TRX39206.1 DUF4173 domain-containing protein [Flavobacterium restrictum]
MKKHHLIFASSAIFTLLFYNESVGVNLAIFGLVLILLVCYFFQDRFTNRSHLVLVIASVLSCLAFAWYGDFVSFLALVFSLIFLQFQTQNSELKIIQSFPVVLINLFASLGRLLLFNQWLPKRKVDNYIAKKIIAYCIIPAFFLVLFYVVYSFGSDHFSGLFTGYELDLNGTQFILMLLLGLYVSFSFWNYWVPDFCNDVNSKLDNDFSAENKVQQQPTFSFLDLDFERKSGEITLILLNLMLLIFIATYNYEQFFETMATPAVMSKLSAATHERVNAVVFSIVMAVGVVLFYFKGGFNFDAKSKNLIRLAKIWIFLNAILIISTSIKNSEYVSYFGLTYKRLGVYAFLILGLIGLLFTFFKIAKQKTNAYLFNQMVWCFYGMLLLCSFVNWGDLITTYNIAVNKGVEPEYLNSLDFNEAYRERYFPATNNEIDLENDGDVLYEQNKSFLSKALYYESITVKK